VSPHKKVRGFESIRKPLNTQGDFNELAIKGLISLVTLTAFLALIAWPLLAWR